MQYRGPRAEYPRTDVAGLCCGSGGMLTHEDLRQGPHGYSAARMALSSAHSSPLLTLFSPSSSVCFPPFPRECAARASPPLGAPGHAGGPGVPTPASGGGMSVSSKEVHWLHTLRDKSTKWSSVGDARRTHAHRHKHPTPRRPVRSGAKTKNAMGCGATFSLLASC